MAGSLNVGAIEIKITLDASQAVAGLTQVEKSSERTRQKLMRLSAGLAITGLAFNRLGNAGLRAFKDIAKTALEFERDMARASAATEFTDKQFEQLTSTTKDLSVALNIATGDVAKVVRQLSFAGKSATQQLQALEPVVRFAKVGMVDYAEATKGVISIMNAFQLPFSKVGEVVNKMTAGFTRSQQEMSDIAEAMGYVAGSAKLANNTLGDTITIISLMADVGIRGSRAGVAMRRALANISDTSKKNYKILSEWVDVYDEASGKMRPLTKIIKDLAVALQGQSEAVRNTVLANVFGVRTLSGAVRLIDVSATELGRFADHVENSSEVLNDMQEKVLKPTIEEFGRLDKQIERLKITIGESMIPIMDLFATQTGKAVGSFNDMLEKNEQTAEFVGTFVALESSVLKVVGSIGLLGAGITALAALSGPLALIVVGLGTIGTLFSLVASKAMAEADVFGATFKVKQAAIEQVEQHQRVLEKMTESLDEARVAHEDWVSSLKDMSLDRLENEMARVNREFEDQLSWIRFLTHTEIFPEENIDNAEELVKWFKEIGMTAEADQNILIGLIAELRNLKAEADVIMGEFGARTGPGLEGELLAIGEALNKIGVKTGISESAQERLQALDAIQKRLATMLTLGDTDPRITRILNAVNEAIKEMLGTVTGKDMRTAEEILEDLGIQSTKAWEKAYDEIQKGIQAARDIGDSAALKQAEEMLEDFLKPKEKTVFDQIRDAGFTFTHDVQKMISDYEGYITKLKEVRISGDQYKDTIKDMEKKIRELRISIGEIKPTLEEQAELIGITTVRAHEKAIKKLEKLADAFEKVGKSVDAENIRKLIQETRDSFMNEEEEDIGLFSTAKFNEEYNKLNYALGEALAKRDKILEASVRKEIETLNRRRDALLDPPEAKKGGLFGELENLDKFAKKTANSIRSTMTSTFKEIFSGMLHGEVMKAEDMFASFGEMVLNILAELMAQLLIVGTISALTGGGFFAGIGNFFKPTPAAVGTPILPSDGLYQLHKGERVLTKGEVDREAQQGGDGNISIINSFDPATVASLMGSEEGRRVIVNTFTQDVLMNGPTRQVIAMAARG